MRCVTRSPPLRTIPVLRLWCLRYGYIMLQCGAGQVPRGFGLYRRVGTRPNCNTYLRRITNTTCNMIDIAVASRRPHVIPGTRDLNPDTCVVSSRCTARLPHRLALVSIMLGSLSHPHVLPLVTTCVGCLQVLNKC